MRISDWSSDVCSSDLLTVRKAADHTLRRSPSHRETVMPIEKRVSSAAAALEGIEDVATVLVSGFGGAGFPNVLIGALRERGPKNLTLVVNSATHPFSLKHELIEEGLVAKVIVNDARGRGKEQADVEERERD